MDMSSIKGPPVTPSLDQVQALALHELVTNAVKYDALKEQKAEPACGA